MKFINQSNRSLSGALAFSLLLLAGCSDSGNNVSQQPVQAEPQPQQKVFTIDVINLTNNQPLSPLAIISHSEGAIWTLNQPASVALENLAESGDNSMLLTADFAASSLNGAEIIPPGSSQSLTMRVPLMGQAYISMATMLVNTNDAISGLNRVDVTNLPTGRSVSYVTNSYDAGTEANSEMAGTIPGPADGGEGFNSIRDDVDFVSLHPGVVTSDDGASNSVLNESHRFDNPVMRVTISRVQ
ncbi:hypothetical protein FLL45_02120 [Aliikangiella marina]|uniref:Spondin domain-containing protein n=1 Tax=Aliikangiella marina TaxID=1712262 RepID=A0A545THV9_9GAMM|nr:spondin domain-containing protein [Aliikangiella marina]TQV76776.1 hypothetical protein FLL45_02120 [Aliikangiella marina]